MGTLKVMTIVGTRPEIIKLSATIRKFDAYFRHVLVHTGQNYDHTLNEVFFRDLALRAPDHYLDVVGDHVGRTMGNVVARAYDAMVAERPDAVVVLGDTNSCLSVIAAKRLKIPIFHLEAGNRCKDENLPEEVIRRIVDVTSDVNLCYSEHARRYILDSGVRPELTFVVGSPMLEVIRGAAAGIEASDVLARLGLERDGYILLSAHREENIDIEANFESLVRSIDALAETYDVPVLYSCHPRAEKMIEQRGVTFDRRVVRSRPFGFFDYCKLQLNALCVVSDSGTLPEESACLKFPAVSIRTSSERPEAIDKGVFVVGSISSGAVVESVRIAIDLHRAGARIGDVPAYLDDDVSTKVLKIVQGYTHVVNHMVWRK
ncbi:MAG TPA: UDP-N-acetyl glucosamine 2-epimerase [Gemmatimonadaceae bacterium]|nr:UDP-N-acetyl glucosamine 2-epimerase [Gemmatimonadaceae bacterium]